MKRNRIYTIIEPSLRFDAKLEIPNQFGCRLWNGAISGTGYGSFTLHTGKRVGAHCYAYERAYGEYPVDLHVCHTCDVYYDKNDLTYRRCCEPTHLILGTPSSNGIHMIESGRSGTFLYDLDLNI